jgi:hypothetical protein
MDGQPEGSEWTVVDFERIPGDFPIRTFRAGLAERDANDATSLVLQLRARGNTMREPQSKKVEAHADLFELRKHMVRIFYMFTPGRVIVLLDGVLKKEDRHARADLDRAVGYLRTVQQRGPSAPQQRPRGR